jgi:hypothetical protein
MASVKEIIYALLNEARAIIREYLQDTKAALKNRLKKLLVISIIGMVLLALVISFIGSASLFILIGSLKYLTIFMPAWQAWYIIGITSGVIGGLLLLVLFIVIRKQLRKSQD